MIEHKPLKFEGFIIPNLKPIAKPASRTGPKTGFDWDTLWADIEPGSALAESRLHDVVVKATQANGGPNLFAAVRGFFLV